MFNSKALSVEKDIISVYKDICSRLIDENIYVEYTKLQMTWNENIIKHSVKWFPYDGAAEMKYPKKKMDRALCLGSFVGALEMSLAEVFNLVVAVDHECFLPEWHQKNIMFHQTNLDSWNWVLPDARYDVCYMIEILEHLMWSPIPLLRWLRDHCNMLVITTPDDDEWPSMPPVGYKRYQHFAAIPSAFQGAPSNPDPMLHVKQYKQHEFLELMTECGFRVLEMQRVGNGLHQILLICTPR